MKKTTILLLWLLPFTVLRAQDFTFSQYQALPYLLNPAETGNFPNDAKHRISGIVRSHWDAPSAENGLFGEAIGWDMRFCKSQSSNGFWSIGAYVQHDGTSRNGIHNLNGRGLAAYHQELGRSTWLTAGFAAGGMQYSLQSDRLEFNSQFNTGTGLFDQGIASGEDNFTESRWNWDADAGLHILHINSQTADRKPQTWFSAGLTLHHLLRPRYSFLGPGASDDVNRLDRGFSIQMAGQFNQLLLINAMYRRQSFSTSRQWQALAGLACSFRSRRFLAGAQIRLSGAQDGAGNPFAGAIVPYAKADFGNCTVRASWDINTRPLANRSTGGLELSVSLYLGQASRCPLDCKGPGL